MKVILIGHPGSQKIRKVSEYLTQKYLPGFDVIYLNHEGDIKKWSKFLIDHLKELPDEFVILALDDYLLSGPIDMTEYLKVSSLDDTAVCAKLCVCTPQENVEYPVTTQYCIWRRDYLIKLLGQVQTPWEFEIKGSQIFKVTGQKALYAPALKYFTNSSLSERWEGVRLDGLNDTDIKMAQQWI